MTVQLQSPISIILDGQARIEDAFMKVLERKGLLKGIIQFTMNGFSGEMIQKLNHLRAIPILKNWKIA
jgi:hypothetical protein